MSIVYAPHVCGTPKEYAYRNYDTVPAHEAGTIWRCDDCDRYWKFRHISHSRYGEWRLIQPWHLISVIRLLRAEARPDHLYLEEQQ